MIPPPFVDVIGVRAIHRYVLELTFSTSEVRVVDVEGLLWGPPFDPLKEDYGLFTSVRVDPDAGTVVWPNGADLSPVGLYVLSVAEAPDRPGDPAG